LGWSHISTVSEPIFSAPISDDCSSEVEPSGDINEELHSPAPSHLSKCFEKNASVAKPKVQVFAAAALAKKQKSTRENS